MPLTEATSLPENRPLVLNEPQKEAVEHLDSHLLVLAGAGSGKTRVLTCKVARLVESGASEPWRILAVTFTNKAAGEMSVRVKALLGERAARIRMGTFHSICAWILRREAGRGGWPENYSIYDADDSRALVRRLLKSSPLAGRCTPSSAQAWISRCKNALTGPEQALEGAATPFEKGLAELFASYDASLRVNGAFDFDDLLTVSLYLLRQNSDILARYSSMFRWILVDEYQDTNLAQKELLLALTGPGTLVCAVGDDDQSIYGWRGARVRNILEFGEDFPGARIIRLEQNYRSTAPILRSASSLVSHNEGRHGKTLWTDSDGGEEVGLRALASPEAESAWILEQASEIRHSTGTPYRNMAVLYRTNAQSRELESAALSAGIPYQIVGSIRFYEREEIKDLIAWLRVMVNPMDRMSLERVLNKPPRGIGDRSRESFFAMCDRSGSDVFSVLQMTERMEGISSKASESLRALGAVVPAISREAAKGAPVAEMVDRVLAELGLLEMYSGPDPEDEARMQNLEEFRRTAYDFDLASPGAGLAGFLARISLMTSVDEYDEAADRICFMTLHCAKGLEFDTVFVAGVEEGLLPFVRPGEQMPSDLEEERRLLYVGMTRARRRLILTYCLHRQRPGSHLYGPSRFLAETSGGSAAAPGRPVAGPEEGTAVYRRGNVVHHPRYGLGIVVAASRRGSEWQLTIDFGLDEPKILLTGYVPIPVVKEKGSPGETFG